MLDSALASAQNTFFYANGDVFDVAAAYASHLAESQCFFDGNKRTGIGAELLFLKLNRVPAHGTPVIENQVYDAMIGIAKHELDKPGLAELLRLIFRYSSCGYPPPLAGICILKTHPACPYRLLE